MTTKRNETGQKEYDIGLGDVGKNSYAEEYIGTYNKKRD